MRDLIIALISIILILFISFPISAKSSDIFIDHLTNIIWDDCKEKDIHINQPCIINLENNQSIDVIKWPYEKKDLRRIIEILGEIQHNFETFYGTCENKPFRISGIDGCGILTCGNNRLDINGYNYFWNNIKVDVPKEEIKTIIGSNSSIIETHGENSPVTTGPNSPVTQQTDSIWFQSLEPKSTIIGTIIGILLTKSLDLLIEYWRTKNKKLNKK